MDNELRIVISDDNGKVLRAFSVEGNRVIALDGHEIDCTVVAISLPSGSKLFEDHR